MAHDITATGCRFGVGELVISLACLVRARKEGVSKIT